VKKFVVELTGTFFLILTIGITADPLAIAAVLMGLIYFGGHISKAHYNPAVTLAFYLQKSISKSDVALYLVAQLIGAVLAGALSLYITGVPTEIAVQVSNWYQATLIEVLFTFIMVLVILNVAIAPTTAGNQFYGLAIAATVYAGIMAAGPISGAAFNPAVSFGHNIYTGAENLTNIAFHTLTACIGAVLGALVYGFTNKEKTK
jgi:aquaporin Z